MSLNVSGLDPSPSNYKEYIIDSHNFVVSTYFRWGDNFTLATCRDKSKWVLHDGFLKGSFCGYLYLKKTLENVGLKNIQVPEMKMTLHKGNVVLLSRYCGDHLPDDYDMTCSNISDLRDKTGFMDLGTVDRVANLKKQNGIFYITDTYIDNFEGPRREAINAYIPTYEAARSYLEQKALEKSEQTVRLEEPSTSSAPPTKRRKIDLDS